MACAILIDGEEAFCTTHLAERLDDRKSRLYHQVKPYLAVAADGIRLDCDRRWRSNCLVPMGIVIQLEDRAH